MCRAANERGGPIRCAADMRKNLDRAQTAVAAAAQRLAALQEEATQADPIPSDLQARMDEAEKRLANAENTLAAANDDMDATTPGLEALERQYAQAVTDDDEDKQGSTLTRIQRAEDRLNSELAERRERWGADHKPTEYRSVPTTPRDADGNPVPDAEAAQFAKDHRLTASARHYGPDKDHPTGSWHMRLSGTDDQGNPKRMTMVIPDHGEAPTMRTVMDTMTTKYGNLAQAVTTHDVDAGGRIDPRATATMDEMKQWRQRLAQSPTITGKDLRDDHGFAAYAMAHGARVDATGTQALIEQAQGLASRDGAPYTSEQAETYARRLATHGVVPSDQDDTGYRTYVHDAGHTQSCGAANGRRTGVKTQSRPSSRPPSTGRRARYAKKAKQAEEEARRSRRRSLAGRPGQQVSRSLRPTTHEEEPTPRRPVSAAPKHGSIARRVHNAATPAGTRPTPPSAATAPSAATPETAAASRPQAREDDMPAWSRTTEPVVPADDDDNRYRLTRGDKMALAFCGAALMFSVALSKALSDDGGRRGTHVSVW